MIEFVYEARKRSVVKAYDTANGVVYNGAIQSITRSGSTATVTKANHGFLDGKSLTIAGADQAAYNGAITVGGATQNTFTYTVAGTPTTPATGNLYLIDTDQSIWGSLIEAIHLVSIAAATTVKLEVSIDLALGWKHIDPDLTSANNNSMITLGAKFNFVRLRRSAGTGAVLAYMQY
jgi:hypothetical protein